MRLYGFTGTRSGMNEAQYDMVRGLLMNAEVLHHGCCVGADEQAHRIAEELGIWTVGHPPDETGGSDRYLAVVTCDERREPKPYLVRDQAIVSEVGILVATPQTFAEQRRGSGTWATIRYARQARIRRIIVLPDGMIDSDEQRDELGYV